MSQATQSPPTAAAPSPWTNVKPSTHTLQVLECSKREIRITGLHRWRFDEGRTLCLLVQVTSQHHQMRALRLQGVLPENADEVEADLSLLRSTATRPLSTRSEKEEADVKWQSVRGHRGKATLVRRADGSFELTWTFSRRRTRIGSGRCVIRPH